MIYYDLFLAWCYTILQAGISTIFSIILALPLVHSLSQYTFWGKEFFFSLLAFFCIMPTKLCALSIKLFYGLQGFPAIISAHVLLNFPFAFYLLHTAYQKIDWLIVWAAADLGASPRQQYKDGLIPQLKPALTLTSVTIFLLCFSSFSIPQMLGTHIYHYTPDALLFYNNDKSVAWICFFLRLLVMIPLGILYHYLLNTRPYKLPIHVPYKKTVLIFNFRKVKWSCYLFVIIFLLIGPLVSLLINAMQHGTFNYLYNYFWSTDPLLHVSMSSVLYNSCIIAMISSIGSLIIGSLLASCQAVASLRFVQIIIHAIAVLPLLSGNVAVGILNVEEKMIGSGFPLMVIVIVSHIMLNYPFVYRIIVMQLYAYPRQLTQLAQDSGASLYQIFYTVLLPFIRSALAKAWLIAFGLSLVEVGASATIVKNIPLTIPLAMRLYYAHECLDGFLGLGFLLIIVICFIYYVVAHYNV